MLAWLNTLLSEPNAAKWIQLCTFAVAALTLGSAAFSLRQQARAADFNAYLLLTEKYSSAWRRFREAKEAGDKDFECTEIFNLIEGVCHLYNKKALRGASRDMIRDYIKEILEGMFRDEYARGIYENTLSGPDTYIYIRKFARNENVDGVPEQ